MKHVHILPYSKYLLNEERLYKTELNSNIWNEYSIDPEVKSKLLQIANDFYKDLKVDCPIIDIQLTGSLANYNWTSHSDLDIHVILDFSQIGDDLDLVKTAMDGLRFIWNLRHPVKIKGFDVELYAQDKEEEHISSGLYSLLNDKWITKPIYEDPKIDELNIIRKAKAYQVEIKKLEEDLPKTDSTDARLLQNRLIFIKKKIMDARKEGLAENGEFSIENLVFKELRKTGWIERLIKLTAKSYSRIYSDPIDSPVDINKINEQLGRGSVVFILGPNVEGGRRLFAVNITSSSSIERNGTYVNMVTFSEIYIVYEKDDGKLSIKPLTIGEERIKKYMGVTNKSLVLNSKTKTPYWFDSINYTDIYQALLKLGGKLRTLENIKLK